MSARARTMSDPPDAAPAPASARLDVPDACAWLAGAAQLVTGFAVGHSFRVPRVVRFSTRFVHDPLAALLLGALAAVSTALLVRFALRAHRRKLGLLALAVGAPLAGVLTTFVSITWMTALRGGSTLQAATLATKATLVRGLYMIPPGAMWMIGPLAMVVAVSRWQQQSPDSSLERAVWAAALLLLAHAEAAMVIGIGIWPLLLGALAVVTAGVCLQWALPALKRASASDTGIVRALAIQTAATLAAAQVWVAVVWLSWRH